MTAFDILTERTEIYDMYIATENLFQHVDNVETLEMASITTRHVHAGYLNEVHPYPRLLKTNGVIRTAIGCIDEQARPEPANRSEGGDADFPCEDKTTIEYNNKLYALPGLGVLNLTRRFPSQRGDKCAPVRV